VEEGDEFTDFAPIFTVGAQRGWGIPLFSRSGSPPSPPTPRRIGQSSSSLPGESDNVRQGWTVKFRHTTRRRLRGVPPVLPAPCGGSGSRLRSPQTEFHVCIAGAAVHLRRRRCFSREQAWDFPRVILSVMTTRLLAAFVLAIAPVACTSMSTYPPTAGKAVSTPNVAPGPEVMAGAIKEAHRITGLGTPVVFNLPAGLQESTWSKVARLVGDAKPMEPGSENVFSVQQLRISGGVAEVDVVYPERGVYQLMTVKFKGGAALAWRVDWAYRWVIPATAPIANTPETMYAKSEAAAPTAPLTSEPAPTTEVAGESKTEPASATNPGE